jgi:hypothetical protein
VLVSITMRGHRGPLPSSATVNMSASADGSEVMTMDARWPTSRQVAAAMTPALRSARRRPARTSNPTTA